MWAFFGSVWTQDRGSNAYDENTKVVILAAYHKRPSLRGLTRIFGVSRTTVRAWLEAWLKKVSHLPPLAKMLAPAVEGDVLEMDELWSFVRQSKDKRWTRPPCVRGRAVLHRLQHVRIIWAAYTDVLLEGKHWATGKGEGQTCHPNKASFGAFH